MESMAPWRDVRIKDRPLTKTSASPELSVDRFGGIGGTVVNGYVLEDQIASMLQLDDHKWDPITCANFEAGKNKENAVMMEYLKLKCTRDNTGPLVGVNPPRVHYAQFAVHPYMRFLRATPDFVVDGAYLVQCKFLAGSARAYPVHIHEKSCSAKGNKRKHCSCRWPPQYANQCALECWLTGAKKNVIAVLSDVDFDCVEGTCPEDWFEQARDSIMDVYQYSRWYWEDIRTDAATAPIREFVAYYNTKLALHNSNPNRHPTVGLRTLVNIDALLSRKANPEDVLCVRRWRASIEPVERPIQTSKWKRRTEEILAPPPAKKLALSPLESHLHNLFSTARTPSVIVSLITLLRG